MDKYDEEVERLVGADGSSLAWSWRRAEPLFQYCVDKNYSGYQYVDDGSPLLDCGCLSMIRGGKYKAFCGTKPVNALTAAIREDDLLPITGKTRQDFLPYWDSLPIDLRRIILNRFAAWQRAMDATIRQGKPWHPEFAPSKAVPAAGVESVRKEETDACKPAVA